MRQKKKRLYRRSLFHKLPYRTQGIAERRRGKYGDVGGTRRQSRQHGDARNQQRKCASPKRKQNTRRHVVTPLT
jgi:hypothetical protein